MSDPRLARYAISQRRRRPRAPVDEGGAARFSNGSPSARHGLPRKIDAPQQKGVTVVHTHDPNDIDAAMLILDIIETQAGDP